MSWFSVQPSVLGLLTLGLGMDPLDVPSLGPLAVDIKSSTWQVSVSSRPTKLGHCFFGSEPWQEDGMWAASDPIPSTWGLSKFHLSQIHQIGWAAVMTLVLEGNEGQV